MTAGGREEARRRYVAERPLYEELANSVAQQIRILAVKERLGCTVTSRAKDVGSFVKKAFVNDFQDPWNEIHDKAGVRVVVRHSGDLDRTANMIRDNLAPFWSVDDRDEEGSEDRLRYPRLHFQVRASALPDSTSFGAGDTRDCEIQVRTAAADLWAVMSHRFLYKPSGDLPKSVRRSLYGLLALVEVYDREVERAVAELAKLPDHLLTSVIDQAENIYYSFCASNYNANLSREIIEVVLQAVDEDERAVYADTLTAFAERERSRLNLIYQRYGALTEAGAEGSFILVGQPESLAIFERLDTSPMLLIDAWNAHLPEELLLELKSLW